MNAAEFIPALMKSGASLSALDDNGNSALACAAMNGKMEALQALLEAGPSQEAKDLALLPTSSRQQVDAVRALIKAGAKPFAKSATEQMTALHMNMSNCISGVDTEVARMLLDAGADANATDEAGVTPLMLATSSMEAVQMLLAAGADAKAVSKTGYTALHSACQTDSAVAVVKLLLDSGAKVHVNQATLDFGTTPLMLAAKRSEGAAEMVKVLLDLGADVKAIDNDGFTALREATGSLEAVQLLLAAGADAKAVDANGNSALYTACDNGGGVAVVRLLLDNGAGAVINQKGRYDWTPLMCAARRGIADVIKVLAAAGADVAAADNSGDTALHKASCEDVSVVRLLLDKGAKAVIDKPGSSGRTALMCAARRYDSPGGVDATKALLAAGADKSLRDEDGQTALDGANDDDVKALLQ